MQHWLLQAGTWEFMDRSREKGANIIRENLGALEVALRTGMEEFVEVALEIILERLKKNARINRSRKTPRTWQLLLKVEDTMETGENQTLT